MDRRGFLSALRLSAVALTLNGLPWPAPADLSRPAFTSEFFKVGDVFTIAGRYQVDPITRQATRTLQRFVVTAEVH